MFDSWEAKFNDVKEWAIPEPGSWLSEEEGKKRYAQANTATSARNRSSSAQVPRPPASASSTPQKLLSSARDVGTASKARRPTNKATNSTSELPIVHPSCNDFNTWSFLARDLILKEDADGISVHRAPSVASNLSSSSQANGLHRRTGSMSRSGAFSKPSVVVDTARTEAAVAGKTSSSMRSTGINPPPPTPEGSVPPRSGRPLGSIRSLLPSGGRTQTFIGSPVNEDAPTEYAVRGSPSPTNTSRIKTSLTSSKTRRDDLNNTITTVDLDDSFSSDNSSTGRSLINDEDFVDDEFPSNGKLDFTASTVDTTDVHDETKQGDGSKRQLRILQSLRWLSAMHIICYHFLAETGNNRWNNFASWGASQLTYFFVLSGFILAYQYTDRGITNIGKFLFKRWARLYPTYILSIIVQCVALPKIGIPVDAGALVAVLFSLTTWIPRYFFNHINTPGWSVGAFLFQYMLLPTLLKPISHAKQATRFKKLLPACWIFSILEAGHGESPIHSISSSYTHA